MSHQVKSLEKRLQGALFERRAHGLTLTHLGAELRAQVEPLLYELDAVTMRFERRLGRRRVLRVGATPFFASELLVRHLSEFTDRHRAIDLRIETVEAGINASTSCDASILLLPAPPAGMVSRPLFALSLTPMCSRELARQRTLAEPRALLDATLIAHNRRPSAWQDWFARVGLPLARPMKLLHFDSMFAVARAAEHGLGVALLPGALCESWLASGALVRPCAGELTTGEHYYFVHRPEAAGNLDVAALGDWIATSFAIESPSRDADAARSERLSPEAVGARGR